MTLLPKASMLEEKIGTHQPATRTDGDLEIEQYVPRCFSIEYHSSFPLNSLSFFLTKNVKHFLSWNSNSASIGMLMHSLHKARNLLGSLVPCKNHTLPPQRCGRSVKWFYPSLMKPATFLIIQQTISPGQLSLPVIFNLCFSLPSPGNFGSSLPCLLLNLFSPQSNVSVYKL